jgi:hypothetical protein
MEPAALSKINVGTAATWRAAGLSRTHLARLAQAGELVRIRYGVYATARIVAEAQADPRLGHALQVAAVTAIRTHKGVASHHSAAQMHGLDLLSKPPDGTVTLTVPPGTHNGPFGRAGAIQHAAGLPDEHVIKLYGVPATTAARTAVDIARTSTFVAGVVVADSALHGRHTSKTELRRVLAHCERWPGISQAREVVGFASALAESVLESCARVSFREQGLPSPALQVHIIGHSGHFLARVDFCWEDYRTIAEADGLLKYQGRDDAIAELKRDRLLREAGYEVVHFTWQELFTDPTRVAARIRAAFDRTVRLAISRPAARRSHYPDIPPLHEA